MDWLSFFIGVLVGWIIEWLIDLFYWRRKWRALLEENSLLRARLDATQAEIRTLERRAKKLEPPSVPTPQTFVAAPPEVDARLVAAAPDVEVGAGLQAPEMELEVESPELPAVDVDADLHAPEIDTEVEVPRIHLPLVDLDAGLHAPEIDTEVELPLVGPDVNVDADLQAPEAGSRIHFPLEPVPAAEMEEPDLSLQEAIEGLRARFPRVDIDGAIDRLRARIPDLDLKRAVAGLKIEFPDLDIDGALDELRARLRRPESAAAGIATRAEELAVGTARGPDDLVLIEGIGPKIAEILNVAGINSFAELAATSPERLGAILQAAGPRYRLADPGSWPEQARLAAAGAWDQLQVLQDRLSAGREGRRPAQ